MTKSLVFLTSIVSEPCTVAATGSKNGVDDYSLGSFYPDPTQSASGVTGHDRTNSISYPSSLVDVTNVAQASSLQPLASTGDVFEPSSYDLSTDDEFYAMRSSYYDTSVPVSVPSHAPATSLLASVDVMSNFYQHENISDASPTHADNNLEASLQDFYKIAEDEQGSVESFSSDESSTPSSDIETLSISDDVSSVTLKNLEEVEVDDKLTTAKLAEAYKGNSAGTADTASASDLKDIDEYQSDRVLLNADINNDAGTGDATVSTNEFSSFSIMELPTSLAQMAVRGTADIISSAVGAASSVSESLKMKSRFDRLKEFVSGSAREGEQEARYFTGVVKDAYDQLPWPSILSSAGTDVTDDFSLLKSKSHGNSTNISVVNISNSNIMSQEKIPAGKHKHFTKSNKTEELKSKAHRTKPRIPLFNQKLVPDDSFIFEHDLIRLPESKVERAQVGDKSKAKPSGGQESSGSNTESASHHAIDANLTTLRQGTFLSFSIIRVGTP